MFPIRADRHESTKIGVPSMASVDHNFVTMVGVRRAKERKVVILVRASDGHRVRMISAV